MDVTLHDDADEFCRLAGALLRRHAVEANIVAGITARWLGARAAPRSPRPVWALVHDGGHVVGAALHAEPYPPALTPMDDDAARAVADALLDRLGIDQLHGVVGPAAPAAAFADRVARRTGGTASLRMDEGVHLLDAPLPPRGVLGSAAPARDGDVDLLVDWLNAFRAESTPDDPPAAREGVAARAAAGGWLLWRVGPEPVSMAHLHEPAFGVARIGPVYTPPGYRRNGYAAALTAAACQRLLASGAERVMLYTDLSNPTSNGVYARVGFRQVARAALWRVVGAEVPSRPG